MPADEGRGRGRSVDAVQVHVAATSTTRSAAGVISGPLSLGIGDVVFPDDQWSDAVVVILAWWLEAVEGALADPLTPQRLRFMDGPYYAALSAGAGGTVNVRGYRRSGSQDVAVTEEALTSGEALRDSVRHAAIAILRECEARGWSSADTDLLRRRIDRA